MAVFLLLLHPLSIHIKKINKCCSDNFIDSLLFLNKIIILQDNIFQIY